MIRAVAVLALAATLVSGTMEKLAGYRPKTQVTDQAAIDLDQMMFEEELGEGRLPKAHNMYEQGGHSMSYAELLLLNPAGAHLFHVGDKVLGLTTADDEVIGYLMDIVEFDDMPGQEIGIKVQYRTSNDQSTYVDCQVGGLFTFGEANRAGCFAEEGNLSIFHNGEWYTFKYTYDIRRHNKNGRTIQMFSTNAEEEMRSCPLMCPYYPDFQLFKDYYGNTDYADMWVESALGFNNTAFVNGRGDAEFTEVEFRSSIAVAAQKGSVYMNIWMYVIKKLEDAVQQCDDCNKEKPDCKEKPVRFLDEAVAFYVGSLEGETGEAKGNLIYDLADWASQSMRTGGEQSNEQHGTSYVNLEVIKQFNSMQESLTDGACEDARIMKNTIVELMKIPLIQGVIISAYKRDHQISVLPEVQEADMAEGATFVAAMLPYLHVCSADDADFIYNKLKIGSASDEVKHTEIKQVLERHYQCLGVTCTHIGGVWTASGYAESAAPCNDGSEIQAANASAEDEEESGGARIGLLIFASLFGAIGAVLVAMAFEKYYMKKKAKKQQPPTFRNIAAVSEIA